MKIKKKILGGGGVGLGVRLDVNEEFLGEGGWWWGGRGVRVDVNEELKFL